MKDRVLGCLLGGALGDALGGQAELERSGGEPKLELSDDTQLTIATCESILRLERVDAEDIAANFARWHGEQRFTGLGSSTLKALGDLSAGVHWALAGARGEYAAGNGAAMRIAPLGFLLDPGDESDRVIIRDVCRITHHHDEAYVGALAVVAAVRMGFQGQLTEGGRFVDLVEPLLPDSSVRDRIRELSASGMTSSEAAARFGASGYVVDTVPLALLCADAVVRQPLTGLLAEVVALGGDADTIGAICGQVAGSVAGYDVYLRSGVREIGNAGNAWTVASQFSALVERRSE